MLSVCERDTQTGTKRYRKKNRESGIELSSARSGLKQRTACKADPWGCPQGLHLLGKEQSRIASGLGRVERRAVL